MPSPLLETDRLYLRPYNSDDGPALHRLWTDPAVRRYLLDDEVVARDFVDQEIADTVALFEEHGYGQWSVRPKEGTDLIGFSGYRPFYNPPVLQLIYGMDPAWWGQGLAVEAARAVLRYGFETLGFETIHAATDAPNTASVRVLDKLGMKLVRRATAHGLDTLFYTLHQRAFSPGNGQYRLRFEPA